jgi:hypothetical protein
MVSKRLICRNKAKNKFEIAVKCADEIKLRAVGNGFADAALFFLF